MKSSSTIRLTVPAELRFRDVAIRTVTAVSRMVGHMDEEGRSASEELDLQRSFDAEIVSAFSELFNNIAIHGFDREGGGNVTIEMTPSNDDLVMRISDKGRSFDIDDVPSPKLDTLPEGGMGIHIARACVDQLDYSPGSPNEWRLHKSLSKQTQE